jgi:hypothetical protein
LERRKLLVESTLKKRREKRKRRRRGLRGWVMIKPRKKRREGWLGNGKLRRERVRGAEVATLQLEAVEGGCRGLELLRRNQWRSNLASDKLLVAG